MPGKWSGIDVRKKKDTLFNAKILALIIVFTALAYVMHVLFKYFVDPRRSVLQFFLYIILHLAAVLLLVFIFSLTLNYFKEFFFTG